ncbi:soluble scavenger receptor cysteine-rich domain-containing protein SSC5D-like [Mauremys reevesii]|uniref:soluble scavenger receptor cysteine-rich domain-containing protein SSC5D-like n=1 Tax=Mauremys reevesii TaxID=260615 RepID=UPI00193ED65B|nr:soluble scavenger receptor cysteine-rich domain-containing protein SSC5D-like [Mauremys reevesii]
MNMGFPGCLLLPAGHPLGRSSAACAGAGNTRIPILLAWLWASMTGFSMADSGFSELDQLRLVNGPSRCAGRVEVFHDQQWGTVCDDGWDLKDAGVVCRQLGCGTALSAPDGAHFGLGSDPVWLSQVNCAGTEAALSDCWSLSWEEDYCNHGGDAGVVCSEVAQLQLVNGPSRCAGRVEVFHNQLWGTVCDDSWDMTDAGVVCRQLGCGMALSAPGGAHFGQGSDPIWLDEVNCAGTEAALADCEARPSRENYCNHGEDAGVVCSGAANEEFRKGVLQVTEEQTQHPWGLKNNTILAIAIPVLVGVILALVLPLVYYLKKKKKVVTNRRKERVQNLYGKNNNPTEDQYTDNKGVAYSHGMGEEAPEPIYENFVLEDVPCSTHHSEQKCESAFPLYVNDVYRP